MLIRNFNHVDMGQSRQNNWDRVGNITKVKVCHWEDQGSFNVIYY